MNPRRSNESCRRSEVDLPDPPQPLGSYTTAVCHGRLLFLSGMLPVRDGQPAFQGRLGDSLGDSEAMEAASLAARNALAVARSALGSLDRVARVVRLTVYVATTTDYTAHARVADAASNVLNQWLGDRGSHVRLVLGVASLPAGMPVELELRDGMATADLSRVALDVHVRNRSFDDQ